MAIPVTCPGCGRTFKVADSAAGKKGACPYCKTLIVVGAVSAPGAGAAGPAWSSDSVFPTFIGHSGPVNACDLSPGGATAITGGEDGSLRLWDAETGRQTGSLAGHEGAINSARLDKAGYFAISGGSDSTVRVWSLANGKCLRTFEGHSGPVLSVAFFPGGALALSGGADRTVRVWDLKHAKSFCVIEGHGAAVTAVDGDPAKELVLSASEDKKVALWQISSGKRAMEFKHAAAVLAARFSPDGKFVISGSADRTATIWSLSRQSAMREFAGHQSAVCAAAMNKGNTLAVTASSDWTVRVWDVDADECTHVLEADHDPVTALGMDKDGRLALAGYNKGDLKLWDVRTGALVRQFGGGADSASILCPKCDKIFQTPLQFAGREGRCPLCSLRITAIAYSPRDSEAQMAIGADLVRQGNLPQAVAAFEQAIRFQGDNRRAYLGAIEALYMLGSVGVETRDWAKAVEALGKATRLYVRAEPWPLELATKARDETYRAAYLAGKIARFQLEDVALATEFLTLAQKLVSTYEVQEMLMRMAAGKPANDGP